ncbi:aminotransferase class I/II-fold pyridoxal phosphate-dependent enzyme [Subtercola boreus]|uniref:GntR family transcriptional regulator n=1 Tax=Subtercola boreus TaxID=120213 RepID=A0A3E0WDP6_9MICO|nr:aminotransferase class I/II-fold pyridoxal phosphate-dependent enzyme [Subtercola boreus]RFA22401.1 GntR family transcriptional regulator [Subtercola boreus]RFA22463.1 GntR family transcriptional regulator [Subtercola boreus]RFA28478.1 GntR family transcriptional regulator [Subtercola boreus]
MIELIVGAVEKKTPEAIAAAVSRLIRSGGIASGDRLPTVRELAGALGVSPATVSNAWQALAGVGLITSRGRAGSFVLHASTTWMPTHFAELAGSHVEARLDLSSGTPDPNLLPSLEAALARVPARADTSSYLNQRVLPELERHLRAAWPYSPESITILDGALDAVSRSLEMVVRYGDRVIVEDPGFPPFFDLIEQLGAERVPVAMDMQGMRPDALAIALGTNPAAIVLQNRAHNPTGASMTRERAEQLVRVLKAHSHVTDPVIIEDDHSGEISSMPAISLGSWLPHRVLHIRSYAKSHGPDLRIGALGGPAALLNPIVARRMLGPGWTSRMLQVILYELLTAPSSVAEVALARDTYAARQRALQAALARRGLAIEASDGINAWLPVHDERSAMVALAASGIRVAAGTSFQASLGPGGAEPGAGASGAAGAAPASRQFVRVTAGLVESDAEEVAGLLAAAALGESAA